MLDTIEVRLYILFAIFNRTARHLTLILMSTKNNTRSDENTSIVEVEPDAQVFEVSFLNFENTGPFKHGNHYDEKRK